ncbi:DUF4328 domain-containing protein [Saccharothrix sp. NPDC042600]|uniref:DUF4328 domain-containing protein n=1 Tax=Saccharothrix TaxID=2071 RepID=UPI0033D32313
MSVAVAVLIGLYTLLVLITAGWMWSLKGVYNDYLDGVATVDELDAAATSGTGLAVGIALVFIPTVVVAVMWLWRARSNAELANPLAVHHWDKGAAIWGWLPVVNFWVPRRVVLDIVRAGVPGVTASAVNLWWGSWLAFLVLERLGGQAVDPDSSFFDMDSAVWIATFAALLCVGAAVGFLHIVRRVTAWETNPATYRQPDPA